jgi:hypothetical protein
MKNLTTDSIAAPGFMGLNTQDSGALLSDGYALVASNCVIDKYGRLGARKGWSMSTTSGSTALSGNPIKSIFEYVNSSGSIDYLSAGNNKVFRGGIAGGLTDITPATTVTNDHWQMVSLANHALLVQKSHEPLFFTRETGSPVCTTVVGHGASHGSGSFASPVFGTGTANGPNCALAAYGRFWVAGSTNYPTTLFWSTDILDPHFPSFDTGGSSTAGSLNIASKLPNNTDEIVGIAAHNGLLIIFCKQNIVLLSGAETPATTMTISDVIPGVGCVARDSIQKTGDDVFFLSSAGLRSLGRTVQEKSLPMRDISKNIRDDVLDSLSGVDVNIIKSAYSEKNAFYLLSFPSTNTPIVYCFDLRQSLQDGSARATVWNNYTAYAFSSNRDGSLFIGKPNGIGIYTGYSDNGSSYLFTYYSTFTDLGKPTVNKIMKKMNTVIIGGGGQRFVVKLGFDYKDPQDSYVVAINVGTPAEYNIAEYNIAEYTSGLFVENANVSVGGQAKTIQVGFEATILDAPFDIQKIEIFTKLGRSY